MRQENLRVALEPQIVTVETFAEKYAKEGETTELQLFERVAAGIAQNEKPEARAEWQARFTENMVAGAIGAGRIMSAAGTTIGATLMNCFVQPVTDSTEGIMGALGQAVETMRRGGGVGYDFSPIRPNGALVKGTHSTASGPCSFMDMFDAACKTVESAGARRGAQMGILRCDHPDIEQFIVAKRTKGRWNNFNVSVAVTDAFMQAVHDNADWNLVHKCPPAGETMVDSISGGYIYRTVKAVDLWNSIMQSCYDFAEPGVVFISVANNQNNLYYCETFYATNPCGEQFLPAYGCCNLGPLILTKFIESPFTSSARFNNEAFTKAVKTHVRFLDNVLDVTHYPLPEQKDESMSKRRIGLGFTGLGDALVMLGVKYNSEAGRQVSASIAETMRNAAYEASCDLAEERGSFPLFDAEKYLAGEFVKRLPESTRKRIRKTGIRNSHLTSIAPTGTVSLAFADNASNGIEPPFSWAYSRKKRAADGGADIFYQVEDHAFRLYKAMGLPCKEIFNDQGAIVRVEGLPEQFVTALEMSVDDHLLMMGAVQPFVDSAISKTINVPVDYPFEDFKNMYIRAHQLGLKGVAAYRPNATLGAVLSVNTETAKAPEAAASSSAAQVADIDPVRLRIEKRPIGELDAKAFKTEYITHQGKKSLYIVMSMMDVEGRLGGKAVTVKRPIEFFIPSSQGGEGQQWISAQMRTLSLAARGGFIADALKEMTQVSWEFGPVRCGTIETVDQKIKPRFHPSEVAAIGWILQSSLRKMGYLDAEGNQVPAKVLARQHEVESTAEAQTAQLEVAAAEAIIPTHGKECPECHAHALVKRDGCEHCEHCGYTGSCG